MKYVDSEKMVNPLKVIQLPLLKDRCTNQRVGASINGQTLLGIVLSFHHAASENELAPYICYGSTMFYCFGCGYDFSNPHPLPPI